MEVRQKANKEILRILGEYLTRYPDTRFCQALLNLGIVDEYRREDHSVEWADEYYTESQVTLWKMQSKFSKNGE